MSEQPQDAATKPTKRTRTTTRVVVTNPRFEAINTAWHRECVARADAGLERILFQDFVDEVLEAGIESRPPVTQPVGATS